MANYRIWCRTEEVGPNQHLAVVTAIPDGHKPQQSSSRIESESRLFTSREKALDQCAEMAQAMAARIRNRGDAVTAIETV